MELLKHFLLQQFEIAFRILETSEVLLYVISLDLVENEDQEYAGGS